MLILLLLQNPGPGGYSAPKSDFDFVEPKRLTDDVSSINEQTKLMTHPCIHHGWRYLRQSINCAAFVLQCDGLIDAR